jgi:hypothetical protein
MHTLVGEPENKRPLEDLCLDGRTVLEWVLENWVGWCELDACGSEQ